LLMPALSVGGGSFSSCTDVGNRAPGRWPLIDLAL
jgi:hypothetical protein